MKRFCGVAEGFVSLAAQLRAAGLPREHEIAAATAAPSATDSALERAPFECERIVEDLALLRLAALEAFERARGRMLEVLAREVLARELMLAPADLDALAARALHEFAESEPLALVVAPADAARVSSPLPVRIDPTLVAGDLVIAVRDGEIDARFALRLSEAAKAAANG
jgi:flagellar biosynthesis/type III secretory pathway protein FliH